MGLFVLVGLFVGRGQVVGLGVELADDAGGDAGDDGVGGHVFRDDRPGPHDGSVPDGDAGDDGDAGADPDVFACDDGGGVGGGAMFRVKVVVHGGQDHVVAQKRPVPQGDAALVLEVAAGVDEDALAHGGVFAAVGVEGGEETEALVHGLADDLGEDLPDLLAGVVLVVQLAGQAHGDFVDLPHEAVHVAAALDGLAGIHSGQIFLQIHSYLLQVGCGGVSRRKRRWNNARGRGSA